MVAEAKTEAKNLKVSVVLGGGRKNMSAPVPTQKANEMDVGRG